MLLLVVQAELDEVGHLGGQRARPGARAMDSSTWRRYSATSATPGPGDHAAPGPGVAGPDPLVVGVEEVGVGGVEGAVPGQLGLEQERLEEPRRVGPVPLGRAHVGHRLDRLVLGGQRSGRALSVVSRTSRYRDANRVELVSGRAQIAHRASPFRSQSA